MSRSIRGNRPTGFDYYSKRPGNYKDSTHSKERAQSKILILQEIGQLYSTDDWDRCAEWWQGYWEDKGEDVNIIEELVELDNGTRVIELLVRIGALERVLEDIHHIVTSHTYDGEAFNYLYIAKQIEKVLGGVI